VLLSFVMERTAYREAGVDISKLDRFRAIGLEVSRSTLIPEVEEISYGRFFLNLKKASECFEYPVEKNETDGIGTKQDLAATFGWNVVAGEDIVTCNVSDILRHGAVPYTFALDFSFSDVSDEVFQDVMNGVCQACKESGVTLVAGETAQMPNVYKEGSYDLMGTASGIVERERLLCPEKVQEEDVILGLASSGLHTNSYSLATKIIEDGKISLEMKLPPFSKNLAETLLIPERNYTGAFLDLFKSRLEIHQIEHIAGGGLTGRLEKIGSENMSAVVKHNSWKIQPIFEYLSKWGQIENEEMLATFNMGVGMVVVLPDKEVAQVRAGFEKHGLESWIIGKVAKRQEDKVLYIK